MPGLCLIVQGPFPHSPPDGTDADPAPGYNPLSIKKAGPGRRARIELVQQAFIRRARAAAGHTREPCGAYDG